RPITPTVSPAKFSAKPAVERPKGRTIGFSSLPPFCKLARVTAKSAALLAAAATNRMRFGLSQNLCGISNPGWGARMDTAAAGETIGASGSGPCAHSGFPKANMVIDSNVLTRSIEMQLQLIVPSWATNTWERRNQPTMSGTLGLRQDEQDVVLEHSFSLERRANRTLLQMFPLSEKVPICGKPRRLS